MWRNQEPFYCKMDFRTDLHKEHESRLSYRTVVKRNNKYLVIKSNEGDIIFPGGGKEDDETPEEAIYRELKEETGYSAASKPEYIGTCDLIKDDKYKANASYEIDCHYYTCEVEDTPGKRTLTASEIALDIVALWLTKEEIIEGNLEYEKKHIDKDFLVDQMEWLMKHI